MHTRKIITLHESLDEQENQDEVIDKKVETGEPMDDKDSDSVPEEGEPQPDPEFVYGVMLLMNFPGKGIAILPVHNPAAERIATSDDIVAILALAKHHTLAKEITANVVGVLENNKMAAMSKKIANDLRSQHRRR